MRLSKEGVIGIAVLLLIVAPLLATVWSTPNAQAYDSDSASLWASPDVLAKIQPGLESESLKQIAEIKLERIKKNLENQSIAYSHERAYRIYSMTNADIITPLAEGGSLGDCISSDYEWYVPLVSGRLTVGTAKLSPNEDGTWRVASYGDAHKEECSLLGDLSKISKLLAAEGLKNVTDIKAAYLPIYHTTMLYIKADGQEYAMVTSEARFTDIVTGKLYTAKDFVDAFERAFGRPVPIDPMTSPFEWLFGVTGVKTK